MVSCYKRQSLCLLKRHHHRSLLTRHLSTAETPLTSKIAIVGTGPSAFYTAHSLLRSQPNLQLTFFEKLPTPFGLSRYGVAPDHSEVKSCESILVELSQNRNVQIYTNVEIGKDISVKELKQNFHSIVFAYGTSEEVRLRVEGEEQGHSKGVILTSREFVDWYNGNPLWDSNKAVDLSTVKDVTIIGNGNVAMDIARLLLCPVEQLAGTDIMDRAVGGLRTSAVERVNIVARRGILQSAFATKELRELIQLEQHGVKFESVEGQDLGSIAGIVKKADRVIKRKVETIVNALRPLSERKLKYQVSEKFDKFWNLQYLKSPTAFQFNEKNQIQVEFTTNAIQLDSPMKVVPTETKQYHTTDLVITSLGYKSQPLPDFPVNNISFNDKTGTITTNGKYQILNSETNEPLEGLYATGWLTKESKGAILNQVGSGMALAEIIVSDLQKGQMLRRSDEHNSESLDLNKLTTWKDWVKLDTFEKQLGQDMGKLRVKLQDLQTMKQVQDADSELELDQLKKNITQRSN
ncbi:hypothetical protein WICPIJ_001898 [Wickerhamomyces pijperi]|uniref:NADPH:adrenodoxin oxidoreductase, mitochondrial n=1 Tax=Wickerhamomyces pijperi TaxID=599730 RepID=A0A9P8QCM4_WICPI|nr:hypothetical protein WICPIJ_001898 [Wickerhamomyces pijperi]